MKTIIKLITLFAAATAWADDSIMTRNAGDYRRAVDEVIREFLETDRIPTIDKALRIQACENDMLALARLDPSLARRMPPLLLANHAKLVDLRHLPGELIAGRAKEAGVDVLESAVAEQTFTYKKGKLSGNLTLYNKEGSVVHKAVYKKDQVILYGGPRSAVPYPVYPLPREKITEGVTRLRPRDYLGTRYTKEKYEVRGVSRQPYSAGVLKKEYLQILFT